MAAGLSTGSAALAQIRLTLFPCDEQQARQHDQEATVTPMKPMAQAIHRPGPIFSFSTRIDRNMTMIGAEK